MICLGSIWIGKFARFTYFSVVTVLILIVGLIIMKRTAFGRKALAAGGNETAANYSGINIDRVKTIVMIFTGTSLQAFSTPDV